jgi:regulator of cell morphogenesis and NO signaling
MDITRDSLVADVATGLPATVKIFQQHQIDFCCGGKRPIAEACAERGLDVDVLLGELRASEALSDAGRDWRQAPMSDLIAYIQTRFHEPLRDELPRLGQMMAKVVSRHGDRLPDVLLPLQQTLNGLHVELLHHMHKEDQILFPAIRGIEQGRGGANAAWIDQPIAVMEDEHDQAGAALARLRELTGDYTPPPDACPTFRGLYYGLAELEREMHVHVHLENNILFPRAAELARAR